jgi:hypothetical protein
VNAFQNIRTNNREGKKFIGKLLIQIEGLRTQPNKMKPCPNGCKREGIMTWGSKTSPNTGAGKLFALVGAVWT